MTSNALQMGNLTVPVEALPFAAIELVAATDLALFRAFQEALDRHHIRFNTSQEDTHAALQLFQDVKDVLSGKTTGNSLAVQLAPQVRKAYKPLLETLQEELHHKNTLNLQHAPGARVRRK